MIEPDYIKNRNSLVISPNMGLPLFIGTDHKLEQKKFEVKLLFATDITDSSNLESFLRDKIKLVPILEYKWKLAKILEKKGIWAKIKRFFSRRKKRKKQETQAIEELTEAGVELIDKIPRVGAEGYLIAFIHPRSAGGVLVELAEKPSG